MNYSRHESVFNPVEWGDRRVDVIGVGATGSKVALSLAKLGVKNLHLWDADVVEEHNLANQVYDVDDIGELKTHMLAEHVVAVGGQRPAVHGFWQGERNVGEVVFMMPDSMKVRRDFFEANRLNPNIKLVVDSRMGSDQAQLYSYRPGRPDDIKAYEATLFDDDDALVEVSSCGTSISVGPTSDIISGMCVWSLIRHAAEQEFYPALAMGGREPSVVAL